MMEVLNIRTTKKTMFANITHDVRNVVRRSGIKSGLCVLYVPHTTAAVFINEGADPDVLKDISYMIEKLIPWEDRAYSHMEGNAAAHIRSAIVGNSRVVPVDNGELLLGTWESIFLVEFDGPRSRRVIVKTIEG
ncbi:MAG: secondary thiamine-phosphate synthase enzyme YjbQ [Aquificaceae bacterium]